MFKSIYYKADIKRIVREPIMVLLFLLPLLISVIFKLFILYLIPFINRYVAFDIVPYYGYILSTIMAENPGMLGTVMGFMMIDDKDGKIFELMSVTPMGRNGYIFLRLYLVFIGTFLYTLYTYYVLDIFYVPFINLILISLILSLYGSNIGLLLFLFATDKVKGLTYAKGLNVLMLFALADLVNVQWVSVLSSAFPTYWITRILMEPNNLLAMGAGLGTALAWFFLIRSRIDRG